MTSISQHLSRSGSLLEALDAVRNARAIVLELLVLVSAGLIFALFAYLAAQAGYRISPGFGTVIGAIGAIGGFLVAFYGINAVGIMLMAEARGTPALSIGDALVTSLATSHRLLVVMLLNALIFIAFVIVLVIVLFICKIPALGPVLYTVVFPVSALAAGLFIFAQSFVVFPLAAPSVWSGSGIFETLARLYAIVRERLMLVILFMILLSILAGFVASITFFIVFSGMAVTTGTSAGIIGAGGGMGSIMGLLGGGMGGGMGEMGDMGGYSESSGAGYMLAASIGGGVLVAIAFILPGLVFIKGACLIYLMATEGLDIEASQAALRAKLDQAREKAAAARERAAATAQQTLAKTSAQNGPPAAPPAAPPAPPSSPYDSPTAATPAAAQCPACNAAVAPEDMFCGSCGHRLKA